MTALRCVFRWSLTFRCRSLKEGSCGLAKTLGSYDWAAYLVLLCSGVRKPSRHTPMMPVPKMVTCFSVVSILLPVKASFCFGSFSSAMSLSWL